MHAAPQPCFRNLESISAHRQCAASVFGTGYGSDELMPSSGEMALTDLSRRRELDGSDMRQGAEWSQKPQIQENLPCN